MANEIRSGPIAVFPPIDLSDSSAPVEWIRDLLATELVARGLTAVDRAELDAFMRRYRVRYTGGITTEWGRALAEELGAHTVLVSSVDLYDTEGIPRIGITSRAVRVGGRPAIIWMDGETMTGDEAPGLLGLGVIKDVSALIERVVASLADSAARGHSSRVAARTRYRPDVHFRAPGVELTGPAAGRVAVLPFGNSSSVRHADDIVANALVRHLVDTGAEVIEPGDVRLGMLTNRLIQQRGPSLPQSDMLGLLFGADIVYFGELSAYDEVSLPSDLSRIELSVTAMDVASQQVVWSSFTAAQGDDGVFFFDAGLVRTAHELAGRVTGALVETATRSFRDADPSARIRVTASPASVPETGSLVSYRVSIENTGPDPLRLAGLSDSLSGDLSEAGDCRLPARLERRGRPGDTYECRYRIFVSGDVPGSRRSTVRATLANGHGSSIDREAVVVVEFEEVLPALTLTRTASPASVPETGGSVTHLIEAVNLSSEPVTLVSLDDAVSGSLDLRGTCTLPRSLAPSGESGDTYACSYVAEVAGDFPEPRTDVLRARVIDEDGNEEVRTIQSQTRFDDVLPGVILRLAVDPPGVPETGGTAILRIEIVNSSSEPGQLHGLTAELDGDPLALPDCDLSRSLSSTGQADARYACSTPIRVGGDFPGGSSVIVTARVGDDDGNTAAADQSEIVFFRDVLPQAGATLQADPDSIAETGESVRYTVIVENQSAEPATVFSLADDEGDLDGRGDCAAPVALEPAGTPGARYSCTYSSRAAADFPARLTREVSLALGDDDGNRIDLRGSAHVDVTDSPPDGVLDMDIKGRATPHGPEAIVTLTVSNRSLESARIVSLIDDDLGSLNGVGSCEEGILLAPTGQAGDEYTCSIVQQVSGNSVDDFSSTLRVTLGDDDGNLLELTQEY